jgi:hypothetical protein
MNPVLISSTWRSILILSSHLSMCLLNGLFPSDFQTKILSHLPMRALWPVHPIHLVSITLIIFGEVNCLPRSIIIYSVLKAKLLGWTYGKARKLSSCLDCAVVEGGVDLFPFTTVPRMAAGWI